NTYQELLDAGMNRDTLLFNMGILYYNNENYQKASESFSAVDCTVFSPQQSIASCYWYSAISSYQAANIASAVSYTEKTISVDSRYKTDAKRFLQYLSGLDKS
ncbi:hypothetical protein QLX67_13345, partial [Balneolaceae bacterium ANBcel3]|nr:hypothetical protein [Balneolaceae bacterium ANBcel3]